MPSTPLELILFFWLIVPGLVYVLQRRRMSQIRLESAFVETARIVFVSVIVDMLAIGTLELVRLFKPSGTPDLKSLLVDNWRKQLSSHWTLDIWWAVGSVLIASLFAYAVARWGNEFVPFVGGGSANTPYNAWWKYFRQDADDNFVGVRLDLQDNRFVEGYVVWFSSEVNDVSDRDLVIQYPKMLFDQQLKSTGYDYMIISAREIKRIHFVYTSAPPTA